MTQTITEALAEIKLIGKKLEKKRQFVVEHFCLQGNMKDPLEHEGGTRETISGYRQSIADLEQRVVDLRMSINGANLTNKIEVCGASKSIAEWLVWRREVAGGIGDFQALLQRNIVQIRKQAHDKNVKVVDGSASDHTELTLFISEVSLQEEVEQHEEILGLLDGRLSLANATIQV